MENQNKIPNITGIRIREMRLEKNWTQKDLANKLGLKNETAIANYESGYSIPKDEVKSKMCEIFGCTMDYLMGTSEFKTNDEMLETYLKTQYEIDVHNAMINSEIYFLSTGLSIEQIEKVRNEVQSILLKDTSNEIKGNSLGNLVNSFSGKQKETIKKAVENVLNYISKQEKYRNVYSSLINIKLNEKNRYYMCPVYGRISAGQPNWAEECIEGRIPIDPELMNIINPEECYFLKINGESMNKVIKNGAFALIRKTDWVENGEIAVVLVNGFDATLKKITKQGNLVILEPMSTDPSFTTQVYDKNTEIKVVGKYIGKMEINN